MQNVVDRVFTSGIAISIEEAKREIAAGIHCQTNLGYQVPRSRGGLGSSNWAPVVRIANGKLIVITSVRAQARCFDLDGQSKEADYAVSELTLRV